MSKWNFLYFNLCPLSIVFSLDIADKSLAAPFLPPSIGCLCIFTRSITTCSSTLFVYILFTNFSHKILQHENFWWQEL